MGRTKPVPPIFLLPIHAQAQSATPTEKPAKAAELEPDVGWRRFFSILRVAASWPVVGFVIAFMVGPQIADLLDGEGSTEQNLSVSAPGMEVTIQTIRARTRTLREAAREEAPDGERNRSLQDAFGERWLREFAPLTVRFGDRTILWLTDEPNTYENRWALELLMRTLRANVIVVGSAESASELLMAGDGVSVDGVIADFSLTDVPSDCSSQEGQRAVCESREGRGSQILYAWTDAGRPASLLPPVIFFSATAARCNCDATLRAAGASGATNRLDDTLLLLAYSLPAPGPRPSTLRTEEASPSSPVVDGGT